MDELLKIIKEKQTISIPETALELNMSEEMIRARLEHYKRLGYLKRVTIKNEKCSGSCKKCRGCSIENREASLILWEKGKKLS